MKRRPSCVATDLPEVADGTTRRLFLLATSAVSTGIGMMEEPEDVLAQQPETTALDDADFLLLSKAAVGRDELDITIASRLCAALQRASSASRDRISGVPSRTCSATRWENSRVIHRLRRGRHPNLQILAHCRHRTHSDFLAQRQSVAPTAPVRMRRIARNLSYA
jgi:hypothetical protein